MYDEFFSKAHELMEQGIPFAAATVVRAEKPTSGKAGDKAIITTTGEMFGWIGGSCAQPTVIKEALKALSSGASRFIRLSPDPHQQTPREGLIDFPMTCFSGGTLEIYIEPQYFRPRLLIVGSLPVAQALANLGKTMNYQVVALDPDGHSVPQADVLLTDLEKVGDYIRPDTFVVVATHGNYDEVALEQVLKAKPAYVGLVASKKRFEDVLRYLRLQGLGDESLKVLKAPAGLDIQARRSDEIALSIMAEIVQRRRNRETVLELTPAPAVAIDPVCGMEVEIASAKHTFEHEGITYYFCCPGCKRSFSKNPAQYLIAIDPVCGMEVEIASAKHTYTHNGTPYYFCCAGCQTRFRENPQQYIKVEATES